jgi:hypothetical protein
MDLRESDREKILAKLGELWKDKHCDICGAEEWGVSGKLFELTEHRVFIPNVEKAVYPLVCVVCSVCGNTRLFQAIALGILDSKTGALIDG